MKYFFSLFLILNYSLFTAEKVNVIVILADDMGTNSISAFNEDLGLKTPRIDSLVKEGLSFTDGHSGSAVCTPTRYGLLTGRYSWRSRLKRGIVPKWDKPLIEKGRFTMADMFKKEGYSTACIGKWHLGWNWPFTNEVEASPGDGKAFSKMAANGIDWNKPLTGGPLSVGFDYHFGDDVINWPPFVYIENEKILGSPNPKKKFTDENSDWQEDKVLPMITQKAVDYIKRQAKSDKPFFLYFPMTSPHSPIAPADEFKGVSGVSIYADFVIETDHRVGQLIDAVDENGLAENTLIIFSADNGSSLNYAYKGTKQLNFNNNVRGGKADIWEGGHKVPFIMRWRGKIKPQTENTTPVCLTDVMATLAEVINVDLPKNSAEDSFSLWPAVQSETVDREAVIHHSISGVFAIREGDYKLIFSAGSGGWGMPKDKDALKQNLPTQQLYNIVKDPKEELNLVNQKPEVVLRLTKKLHQLIEQGRSNKGPKQKNVGTTWLPKL